MRMIVTLFLIPITIADLRNHVIPNIYVKVLSCFMLISFMVNGLPRSDVYLPCLFIVTVFLVFKVGMGDIKLLTILILTFNCQILTLLTLMGIAAAVHIVISTARNRTVPHSIPLAPAIFFAFTTYLATG
jgi:Flp pilus assembly protein protease CpaA